MKVVVVGSGGREHALADTFSRQGHEVLVTPGNAGIPWSTATAPEDLEADLFVIGPEQPLVDGLADELRMQGKIVAGPGSRGAKIEGSKETMKKLLAGARVPTADFRIAASEEAAEFAISHFFTSGRRGCAIKTDGLAAGKGVTVCYTPQDALNDARSKLSGESFGDAGRTLVIEELLGEPDGSNCYERSLFAVVSVNEKGWSRQLVPVMAQDYKRLTPDRNAPMTGGMGCFAPTGDEHKMEEWAKVCIDPVLQLMHEQEMHYSGFIYFGLMIVDGEPFVLEINVRFGDPEAETILPLVTSDLASCLLAAAKGETIPSIHCSKACAVTVILAAPGYPEKPVKGDVILGLQELIEERRPGISLYCAGVDDSGFASVLLTYGGRVIAVTAIGFTGQVAHRRAYEAASGIKFKTASAGRAEDTKVYRDDIAEHWR